MSFVKDYIELKGYFDPEINLGRNKHTEFHNAYFNCGFYVNKLKPNPLKKNYLVEKKDPNDSGSNDSASNHSSSSMVSIAEVTFSEYSM